MAINWAYFPRSATPDATTVQVVAAFEKHSDAIDSDNRTLKSNEVLAEIAGSLESLGFLVESGKKKADKVHVPVLYGNNGKVTKSFEADAYHAEKGYIIEVEAGRGVVNNQFLKDLFQACMMEGVEYLCIAVRNQYMAAGMRNQDFKRVVTFFDTLYASNRLSLPMRGILIAGY